MDREETRSLNGTSRGRVVREERLGDQTVMYSLDRDWDGASGMGSSKNVIGEGSANEDVEVDVKGYDAEDCRENQGSEESPGRELEDEDEGIGVKNKKCFNMLEESGGTIEVESNVGRGEHSKKKNEEVPENHQPRKRQELLDTAGTKRSRQGNMETGSTKHPAPPPQPPPTPPFVSQTVSNNSKRAPVKPVQNWKKAIRLPTSLEQRLASDQIFRAVLPTYVPRVPRGTSQRLVEYLTPTDLEQLCCPGCKDRFLLPSSFFQHVYRKSVKLTFACSACEGRTLTFFNRCHLRTHVVGHMERDGVSAVSADRFDAAPLDDEELSVGLVDDAFDRELNLAHGELAKLDPSLTQCHECRLSVNSDALIRHYNESSDNALEAAECQHCNMMLPNMCSRAAHERIHEKLKPFVCPECSTVFQTWSVFQSHVQTSCLHEARVLSITCRICLRQDPSNEPAAAVLQRDFLAHIFQSHTKLLYKCTGCAKAFDSKTAIYAHRDEHHGDACARGSDRIEADFSLLYKAPWLPSDKGGNLFSSRQSYQERLGIVTRKWKRRFGFRCFSCRTLFAAREELESHNPTWCHMQNNNGTSISPLNGKFATALFPSESESKWVDREKELDAKLEEIRKLFPQKCAHCYEMLSLLRAHFASHLEDEGATKRPETFAPSEDRSLVTPFDPPPPKKSLRSSHDKSASPAWSKILDSATPLRTSESVPAEIRRSTRSGKEAMPPNVVTTNRAETKQFVTENDKSSRKPPSYPVKPEPTLHSSLTGKESPPAKRKVVSKIKPSPSGPVPFVESLGKDVPSHGNLLRINRIDKKALASGCSVTTTGVSAEGEHGNRNGAFSCNLCKFVTDTQISFEAHILIHQNKRYGNAFQCKECGVSFSSEASWRTHLLILHRIKAPKAADFCTDSRPSRRGNSQEPTVSPKKKSITDLGQASQPDNDKKAEEEEDDGRLVIDEKDSKPFRSRQNVCSVCRSAFSSPLELQRHFRGHGMAFLKGKNPLMKGTKNPLLTGLMKPRDK